MRRNQCRFIVFDGEALSESSFFGRQLCFISGDTKVAVDDRLYRRVRIGTKDYELLQAAWFSFDSTWEGVPILARWESDQGWVVYGFLGNAAPDEVVDLLPGDPCDSHGDPL